MNQLNHPISSAPLLIQALPAPISTEASWEQLYRQAIAELDHAKFQERIIHARHAILDRAEEILTLPPSVEQRALNHAFKTLRMLEDVAAREELTSNQGLYQKIG